MKESTERLKSMHLQNERTIWIREPRCVATAKNLTVILDGELYRERVGAVPLIDELDAHEMIADSWFVFVSMESIEARWKECPCHLPFAKFITEELLPWLERRHPEIGLVRERTIVGLSYTGLAAAYIVNVCSGVFHKVICQSGSFWWRDGWLIEAFRVSPVRIPTKFYLDVGQRENQKNVRHREEVLQVESQIEAVQRFRQVLLQQGYCVVYVEFDGGHDFDAWKTTLPGALAWALPTPPTELKSSVPRSIMG
jgi:enterochelin esterase-like enzyme